MKPTTTVKRAVVPQSCACPECYEIAIGEGVCENLCVACEQAGCDGIGPCEVLSQNVASNRSA